MIPSLSRTFGTKVRPGNVAGAMHDICRGTGYANNLYNFPDIKVLGGLGFERGRQPTTSTHQ